VKSGTKLEKSFAVTAFAREQNDDCGKAFETHENGENSTRKVCFVEKSIEASSSSCPIFFSL
jgi:hypothetical protein